MPHCWSQIFIACPICVSLQRSWAGIACPVSLFDGTADQDGGSLSFRNVGKLPIQQLTFDCATTRSGTVRSRNRPSAASQAAKELDGAPISAALQTIPSTDSWLLFSAGCAAVCRRFPCLRFHRRVRQTLPG